MNDDLLDRAARVVRERYDGESALAAGSEGRILEAFAGRSVRHRRLPLLVVPLVAALLASVAWGTVSEKMRALVHPAESRRDTSAPIARKLGGQPAQPMPSAPPPEPTACLSLGEQLPPSPPPAAASGRSAPPSPAVRPAPPHAVAASESEITELYRAAHRAQFIGTNPDRALELWDRYLNVAPNGALSPEARYNRAIALARLGRKGEAAAALAPFADGDYGGYRQSEGKSLLEVLRPDK